VTSGAEAADVVVVGGGQSALAAGFYLRRTGLSYVLLDAQPLPGGAWRRAWRSLHLFSPARWSSLPGWQLPTSGSDGAAEYPTRDEVVAYLAAYEQRYALPVVRPVRVDAVRRDEHDPTRLRLESAGGVWRARAVVSATGTWAEPYLPPIEGGERFGGVQLHSAHYASPEPFAGRRVVVVGGGNSGAQIVADLAPHATVTWATLAPPTFLPDHVDGRYLFEQATARYAALKAGREPDPPRSLGDVVAVESVRRARDAGHLASVPAPVALTPTGARWPDGRETREDAVIWCTGFRPALTHLRPLAVVDDAQGRARVAVGGSSGTRSLVEPRLWLLGYGDWTGYASATLVGVGRSARAAVDEIAAALSVG
jgi:cation diffusion facilitator CzcD-associated flavoprotein CzcO